RDGGARGRGGVALLALGDLRRAGARQCRPPARPRRPPGARRRPGRDRLRRAVRPGPPPPPRAGGERRGRTRVAPGGVPLLDDLAPLLTTARLGRPARAFETVESTMAVAAAWAAEGAPEGALVV